MEIFEENLKLIQKYHLDVNKKIKPFLNEDIHSIRTNYSSNVNNDNYEFVQLIDETIERLLKANGHTKVNLEYIVEQSILLSIQSTLLLIQKNLYPFDDSVLLNLAQQIKKDSMETLKKALIFDEMFRVKEAKGRSFNWIEFKKKFPVALHRFYKLIHSYLSCIEWVASTTQTDLDDLQRYFKKEFGSIKSIQLQLGDPHIMGKSVSKITFSNITLILKPRNANIEELFQIILNHEKRNNSHFGVKIPPFKGYSDHSWHLYMEHADATSKVEEEQYYYNVGCLSALSYIFSIKDLHHENILCRKNQLYLLDLECMFYGYKQPKTHEEILENSVLSSYITPPLFGQPAEKEICGISLPTDKKIFGEEIFKKDSEGNFYREIKYNKLNQEGKNHPNKKTRSEKKVIQRKILSGFSDIYTSFESTTYKKELIALINKYQKYINTRNLYRSTRFYGSLLKIVSHPRYLFNSYDSKIVLACNIYSKTISKEIQKKEYESLIHDNIPYFTERLTSVEIINRVNTNLSKLNSYDFKLQYHLLKISINSLFGIKENGSKSKAELSEEIFQKVQQTTDKPLMVNGQKTLLSCCRLEGDRQLLKFMDRGLYFGESGLLFLKICNLIAQPDLLKQQEIIRDFLKLYDESLKDSSSENIGVFNGIGSLLYLYYLLQIKLNSNIPIKKFTDLMDYIITVVNRSKNPEIDIINGVSGVLIVCCRIYKEHKDKRILDYIDKLATIITDNCNFKGENITWHKRYAGMAHGNSGIIYALSLSNEFLLDNKLQQVIKGALAHEYSLRTSQGWRDLRYITEQDPNAWCHGAMGIILTRYSIQKECSSLDNSITKIINDDIKFYDETISKRPLPKGNSLCHGLAGVAMINKIINNKKELSHYKELLEESSSTYNPSNNTEDKTLMTGKLGEYYVRMFLTEENMPNILLLK